MSWYNDPENHEIRAAVAGFHDVPFENVSVGSGIDDLLGLVVRVFVAPGETVVTSLGAYPTFNYHVSGFGGLLRFVPYRDDRNDLEGLAGAAAETGARLAYLSNPDNPAGTWHTAANIRSFEESLPERCMLILDEAYSEFSIQDPPPPMAPIRPRVIRMRTFSKAHGMAGARIGYAIADTFVVEALEKVRHHYGVNRVAQAGALASLQDTEFVGRRCEIGRGRAGGLCAAGGRSRFAHVALGHEFRGIRRGNDRTREYDSGDAATARRICAETDGGASGQVFQGNGGNAGGAEIIRGDIENGPGRTIAGRYLVITFWPGANKGRPYMATRSQSGLKVLDPVPHTGNLRYVIPRRRIWKSQRRWIFFGWMKEWP